MSENFPFETVEQFLQATEKEPVMPTNNDIAEADAVIHAPTMPETTRPQIGSAVGIVGILALAFTSSNDWRVQLAAIVSAGLGLCATVISDALIRRSRNDRIGMENATMIDASANVRIAESE